MELEVIIADYNNEKHGHDVVNLLDCYACDPMGGSKPLSDDIRDNLVNELKKRSNAFSVLAYIDGHAAGLANCFEGFSTFKCKPLINIHDMVVHPDYRGQGISQNLMSKVEEIGRDRGACKITLEVLTGNVTAQNSYKKFGFTPYELDPAKGQALFWEKEIV